MLLEYNYTVIILCDACKLELCLSILSSAVQNERDRISVRRPSYDDVGQNGVLSVNTLLNAELLSRQVCASYVTQYS